MVWVLTLLEKDLHGYPLHHLHVVSRRILGRQEAVARTAGAGDAVDVTVIVPVIGVNVESSRTGQGGCGLIGFL